MDAHEQAKRAAQARIASTKAKGVDPLTTEREYSADEVEFANAMQEYKRKHGRPFPTWSEALRVLRTLGYHKMGRMS